MVLHFWEQCAMARKNAKTTLGKTLRSRGHRVLIATLVAARKKAGMTQRDLAARIKRPRSFVGRMEAGERRIDVIEFIQIARAVDGDPKELFGKLVR
jgi:ribosome-binding protein aMBF1 (putative translation factor)